MDGQNVAKLGIDRIRRMDACDIVGRAVDPGKTERSPTRRRIGKTLGLPESVGIHFDDITVDSEYTNQRLSVKTHVAYFSTLLFFI